MFIGNVFLLIINLPLVGVWASLLKIDFQLLMPIITVITFTGAYAINNSIFDLGLMTLFGVLGFFLKAADYDLAALAIGLFLGPQLEAALVQTMVLYNGNLLSMIFDRPIAGSFCGVILLVVLATIGKSVRQAVTNRKVKTA